jgi:hypothetical protein
MEALGTTLSRYLARLGAVSRLGCERLRAAERPLGLGGGAAGRTAGMAEALATGAATVLLAVLTADLAAILGAVVSAVGAAEVDAELPARDRGGGLGSQLARGHAWEGNVLESFLTASESC